MPDESSLSELSIISCFRFLDEVKLCWNWLKKELLSFLSDMSRWDKKLRKSCCLEEQELLIEGWQSQTVLNTLLLLLVDFIALFLWSLFSI